MGHAGVYANKQEAFLDKSCISFGSCHFRKCRGGCANADIPLWVQFESQ